MPCIGFRQALRPGVLSIVLGLAALLASLTAGLPASAATGSPASATAASTVRHLSHSVAPDNRPPIVHSTRQFLSSHPSVNDPNICNTTFADLSAGNYEWLYLFNGQKISVSGGGFTIRKSDNFEWVNCLITEDGYYVESTSLFDASLDQIYDGPNVNVQLPKDAQVTWGSEVQPLF